MKWLVLFRYQGGVPIEVEAENSEEAEKLAVEQYRNRLPMLPVLSWSVREIQPVQASEVS